MSTNSDVIFFYQSQSMKIVHLKERQENMTGPPMGTNTDRRSQLYLREPLACVMYIFPVFVE